MKRLVNNIGRLFDYWEREDSAMGLVAFFIGFVIAIGIVVGIVIVMNYFGVLGWFFGILTAVGLVVFIVKFIIDYRRINNV